MLTKICFGTCVHSHCNKINQSTESIVRRWLVASKYITTDFLISIPNWCHSSFSEGRVKLEWLLSLMWLFGLRAPGICNRSLSKEFYENWELWQILDVWWSFLQFLYLKCHWISLTTLCFPKQLKQTFFCLMIDIFAS